MCPQGKRSTGPFACGPGERPRLAGLADGARPETDPGRRGAPGNDQTAEEKGCWRRRAASRRRDHELVADGARVRRDLRRERRLDALPRVLFVGRCGAALNLREYVRGERALPGPASGFAEETLRGTFPGARAAQRDREEVPWWATTPGGPQRRQSGVWTEGTNGGLASSSARSSALSLSVSRSVSLSITSSARTPPTEGAAREARPGPTGSYPPPPPKRTRVGLSEAAGASENDARGGQCAGGCAPERKEEPEAEGPASGCGGWT